MTIMTKSDEIKFIEEFMSTAISMNIITKDCGQIPPVIYHEIRCQRNPCADCNLDKNICGIKNVNQEVKL